MSYTNSVSSSAPKLLLAAHNNAPHSHPIQSALSAASTVSILHIGIHFHVHVHGGYPVQPKVKLLIGGKFVDSETNEWIDVRNPVSAAPLPSPPTRSPTRPPSSLAACLGHTSSVIPESVSCKPQ